MKFSNTRNTLLALLCCVFSTALTAQTFTSTNYTVGTNPQKLIRADFNGDGAIDLATANGDGTVTILLNNGDGTFRRQDAVAGANLTDIAAADINNDGKQDLIVLNNVNNTTQVMTLTGRGDGTFNAPAIVDTKQGGAALAVADFNGDHNTDIAFGWNNSVNVNGVAETKANVTIYFGNGTGTFPTHTDMLGVGEQADFAGGENGYQINVMNVGDFNHDGKMDFAIGERHGGYDVELGNGAYFLGNGDGTFTQNLFWPSTGQHDVPLELRVSDVDGNGTADILLPFQAGHSLDYGVDVFRDLSTSSQHTQLPNPYTGTGNDLGIPSATFGKFTASSQIAYSQEAYVGPSGTQTGMIHFAAVTSTGYSLVSTFLTGADALHWLTSGDFNKDGFDDLAGIASQTQVTVLTNKGSGTGTCSATSNRTVKICSPAAGSTVTSPVHVLAGLRSDSGITAAQIYVDGTKVYQAGAGTTTVDQSLTLSAGTHKITVKGWDSAGSFSTSETITVGSGGGGGSCTASANRTVNICSPVNGSTDTSPVHVLAGLRSDSGITAAQIYLDGTKVYQAPAGTKTVDQNLSMAVGSHRITVKGWDSTGSFSSSVSITVH